MLSFSKYSLQMCFVLWKWDVWGFIQLFPNRDKKWCADDSVTYYTQGNVEHPRVPIANSWQMQTYLEGREPLASVKLDKNILRGDTIQIRNTDMVIREVRKM